MVRVKTEKGYHIEGGYTCTRSLELLALHGAYPGLSECLFGADFYYLDVPQRVDSS